MCFTVCAYVISALQVSGDLDEVKYACNVSDELAERIARNVKVNLKDFVFYV